MAEAIINIALGLAVMAFIVLLTVLHLVNESF